METSFVAAVDKMKALRQKVPAIVTVYYDEIVDTAEMTALRATQVHRLYNYASSYWTKDKQWRQAELDIANQALAKAISIVARRESQYRVPVERIAGWRDNPTSYGFGYLWSVHSLYYFWRDYAKAVDETFEAAFSPCYLNIQNPINVAFGEGIWLNVTEELYKLFEQFGWMDFILDCLAPPTQEPKYPADLGNKVLLPARKEGKNNNYEFLYFD